MVIMLTGIAVIADSDSLAASAKQVVTQNMK